MSEIDVSSWKSFCVGDLFMCDTTLNIPSKNDLIDGDINYITRSAVDNGLSGFCGNTESLNKGQCITIGAEGFVAFWQPDDFVAGNKVYTLRHKDLNEVRALFVCAALNVLSKDYSFANARVLDKIKKEVISLPATPDGQPDWAYMDAYMGEVLKKEEVFAEHLASLTAEAVVDGHPLDTSEWKAFRIGELFEILLAKGDIQPKQVADGMIPLVSAGNEDNGIVAFIDEAGDGVSEIFPAGCITVSMFGKAFYQPERFYAVSHGRINILQPKIEFSSIVGTFLTTCLSRVLESKYDYATMCTQKKLATEAISLPVTSDGTPDWAWMEQYMQRQMDKAAALVEHLDAVWN